VEPRAEESACINKDVSEDPTLSLDDDDMHLIVAGTNGKSLWVIIENNIDLPELFRKAYYTNTVCSKILAHLRCICTSEWSMGWF
jgi:hypothetical protein